MRLVGLERILGKSFGVIRAFVRKCWIRNFRLDLSIMSTRENNKEQVERLGFSLKVILGACSAEFCLLFIRSGSKSNKCPECLGYWKSSNRPSWKADILAYRNSNYWIFSWISCGKSSCPFEFNFGLICVWRQFYFSSSASWIHCFWRKLKWHGKIETAEIKKPKNGEDKLYDYVMKNSTNTTITTF